MMLHARIVAVLIAALWCATALMPIQASAQSGLRIDQLGVAASPADGDITIIEQGAVLPAKKVSLAALKAYLSPYTGPADLGVSSAANFWGLRALSAAVASPGTQKAINIRRSSDNTSIDVNILATGYLDTATASAFCGASVCAITKMYDQTGHGADLSQTVTANQPTLTLNCIGSKPCVQFGGSQWLTSSAITAVPQPLTYSAVAERTGNTAVYGEMISSSTNTGAFADLLFNTAPNGAAMYNGGTVLIETAADSAWHSFQAVFSDADATTAMNVDGTDFTGLVLGSTAGTSTSVQLGVLNNVQYFLTGSMMEAAIWSTGITAGNRAALSANQHAAWGF